MSLFSTSPVLHLKQVLLYSGLSILLAAGSVQAQSGNTLDFDGTDDYVSLPASLTTGVTNFTFEAWLNYQDNGDWTRVMDFGQNTTVNMFLTPRNDENGAPRFAITTNGNDNEQRLTSTTALSAGQHHLAVTLSQSGPVVTGTLYVDGAVVATNAEMTLTPNSLGALTNLYLGRSQYLDDPYLKGDLDEVRMYSTALTQVQIQTDMTARNGVSAVPASLLAYYDFNQGIPRGTNPTVINLLDQSSNAQTGTLFNFALTGSTSNWIGGTAPLPVTLVSFEAHRQREDGLLTWTTASEAHNAYFEVESSSDGVLFRSLGRVAGAGTTRQAHTYQFLDTNLAHYASVVYYRLRQVDTDGTSAYSAVRLLAIPIGVLPVEPFPIPLLAGQNLNLQVRAPQAGLASLFVTDALGRVILQQPLNLPTSTTTFSLPQAAQWKQGLYVLRVQQGSWQQVAKVTRE